MSSISSFTEVSMLYATENKEEPFANNSALKGLPAQL